MSFNEKFAENGFLTATSIFKPDLIDEVHLDCQRQLKEIDEQDVLNVGKSRIHWPVLLTGPLLDSGLYGNPMLLAIIGSLLGRQYLIDSVVCVSAQPGSPAQRLHRDHPHLFMPESSLFNPGPPFAIAVGIPLIDLTPETGTFEVYPGSHTFLSLGEELQNSVVPEPLYLQKGQCFLFDYRLFHRGLANTSKTPRTILYITYALPWFIDMLNYKLHARIRMRNEDFATVPLSMRPLFRRLSTKDAFDVTESELLGKECSSDRMAGS